MVPGQWCEAPGKGGLGDFGCMWGRVGPWGDQEASKEKIQEEQGALSREDSLGKQTVFGGEGLGRRERKREIRKRGRDKGQAVRMTKGNVMEEPLAGEKV